MKFNMKLVTIIGFRGVNFAT